MITKKLLNKFKAKQGYFVGIVTGILLTVLLSILLPILLAQSQVISRQLPEFIKSQPTPTPDVVKLQAGLMKEVLPDSVNLEVTLGDTVVKMVQNGIIDKKKFEALYNERGGLNSKELGLLDTPSTDPLIITQQNANLILNLLWPLGIANKSRVLSEGPMGTQYKNDIGNFASTGGWTLGKEDGGRLFDKFPLLLLSSEQEFQVKEIAENIYRPCCGNSTYFPDCNHGAAMLGFIELAVVQGMPKEKIYKKALILNSYWFPQTYADLAMYFKTKYRTEWSKVDAKEVLGAKYSSSQGFLAVDKELQSEGLLPKVEGGGGCGV